MKLSDFFKQEDVIPTIQSNETFGRSLSRGEIVGVLVDGGYDMPSKNVSFYIVDANGKMYHVRYLADRDEYKYSTYKSAH